MTSTTTTRKTATKKRAPRTTPEERREQAAALHESITEQVEALRDTEQWRRFLSFASSFHRYSLGNLLLILAQRPDASAVAGFRAWQGKGRQVRKGEKAIKIFGFAQRKIDADEESEEGTTTSTDEKGQKVQTYYPLVSVFAIEQTDLMEGAEDPRDIARPLTGAEDHGVIAALSAFLEAEDWTVERRPLPQGTSGYARPEDRTVVVGDTLAPEQAAKTLIHETAHILLGHVDDLEEYAQHRGLMETEAEGVAFVVAGLAGFDTSAYSVGYIAGWSNCDADVIRGTAARVLTTAHRIAEILDGDEADAEDEDA
ncbi:ArdC-like ssDNA-binding domain-containing protein [Rathayibacter sp. VKM Ac-2754]|uniref:ArdC-like ssDNA-binding domain-containing protein n=1 Tax=Rathayibacter sp. VKM Ac-2754 TaxID=2609251 RepID=UPI001357AC15|nr:ArdC-like ssDNA-binding domain-containing protein [Rathayibacter sp. VKM Ac-2754]MWV60861.1 ImmA/IrrE family metallo-endopeptidase [Rathayibacter sp. VKM Ac-2754]